MPRRSGEASYHTLELPGYTTPGWFDLRPYVAEYGLPDRLDGVRALDVGTWDGFWAFEHGSSDSTGKRTASWSA